MGTVRSLEPTRWGEFPSSLFVILLHVPLQRLPTTSRPEEVQWWIKRKKIPGSLPHIKKPSEFGAVWTSWWVKMQPAWCGGEFLVRTLPTDADWEPILRGGSNGLSMVVMALSWWVHATESNGQDSELLVAIDDVKWVFSKLVATLLTSMTTASMDNGKKRCSREETTQEELSPKRCV